MVGQAFLPASAGHSCPAESARGVPLAEAEKNVCPTEHLRRDMSRTLNVRLMCPLRFIMVGQAFLPASAGHSCPAESARGVPLAEADKNVCPTEHRRRDMSPTSNVQPRQKLLANLLAGLPGRGSERYCSLGSTLRAFPDPVGAA